MPGGTTAPGADDDGSGVCAVMEAARVMAGHDFENTVVFALWDEEEQGLIGSAYYTSAAAGNDEEILAAVQMDAIGYDGNGDGLMRIHTRPVANSIAIKDSVLMVNTIYGLGLPIVVNNPGATYSDHASFWSEGYGASRGDRGFR
ncbi:MAG: M20/M25/M40 family metallo-hydrolase [Flavobacteriales bacterium]|nr:M20/M25/M40 family metallo-hydrolase [Flavobacteriales bacterium]